MADIGQVGPPRMPPIPPLGDDNNQQLINDLTTTSTHIDQLGEVILNTQSNNPNPDPNLPSQSWLVWKLSGDDLTALKNDQVAYAANPNADPQTGHDLLFLISQLDPVSIQNYINTANTSFQESGGTIPYAGNINGESYSLLADAQQVVTDLNK